MLQPSPTILIPLQLVVKELKWILFFAILLYMGYKITHMEGFFHAQWLYFLSVKFSETGIYLLVSVLLSPVNCLFEALKWKEAAHSQFHLSLAKAWRGVVTGQALNLVAPLNVGHVGGRLLHLEILSDSKWKAASLVIVCQVAQFIVTFLAFIGGIFFIGSHLSFFSQTDWMLIFVCSFLFSLLFLFLFLRFRKHRWSDEIFNGIKELDTTKVVKIFLYSVLRYLTFSTQFVLMLYFMGVEKWWLELYMALSLVFMAKSLMPSFHFLSDLGVREFAALLVLPALGLPENVVVASSLWVWLVNIFLPSVFGSLLLLKTKTNALFC